MNPSFPHLVELRDLLDALCDQGLSPAQMRRLEELLAAHPEAEAYYVQYMSLHADLAGHFAGHPGLTEQTLRERAEAARPPRRFFFRGALALAGAAAGLLIGFALWYGSSGGPASGTADELGDNTVAILLQAPGAEWGDTELPTRPGAPLPPGWLRLKSGFAHLEFYSGATVILEGPAELRLVSRLEAFCARGKLRASVPPQAHGFTIGSPKFNLVDRGTEFGLQVDAAGKTEVHVFQGRVDLYDPATGHDTPPQKALSTGGGVRVAGPGLVEPIRPDPAAFETAQRLADRAADDARRRHGSWLGFSESIRRDPRLLVYYPFQAEKGWSRTLLDLSRGRGLVPGGLRPRPEPHDGAIVGCSWVTGRWPGKQGLEFKRVSDRVRLNVPGEFDSLTLMAWVRVDALPNKFNSLFMTDSWDEAAPHWHISDAGKLELGVQGPRRRNGVHYYSPVVFTPDRLGQWIHLAVVHDRNEQLVSHYVDGRLFHQEALQLDVALRLGNAEIGNWNVAARRHNHPIRYFSGCIDEFFLFSRALTSEEIELIYSHGRPPF